MWDGPLGMNLEESIEGAGRLSVQGPSPLRVGKPGTWRVTFRLGPGTTIETGGEVRFSIEREFAPPQVDDPARPGYTTVETTVEGAGLELVRGHTFPDLLDECGFAEATRRYETDFAVRRRGSFNRGVNLFAVVREGRLSPGDEVTLVYGDARGDPRGAGVLVSARMERCIGFRVAIDPDGQARAPYSGFRQAGRYWVDLASGPPERLLVAAPTVVGVGDAVWLNVALFDAGRLLCRCFEGDLRVEAADGPITVRRPHACLTHAHGGHVRLRGAAVATAPGVARLWVTAPGGPGGMSNPILVRPSGDARPRVFWGDVHLHSRHSDGPASIGPADYCRIARDVYGLDFASVTDHDAELVYRIGPDDWREFQQAARQFNSPGEFVTLLGYEYSERLIDGDRNVYFLRDDAPIFRSCDSGCDSPEKLWAKLASLEAMTVPHHTVSNWIGASFGHHDVQIERLVEIFSCWGSSEAPGCARPVRNRRLHTSDYERKSVFAALKANLRFGIIASGDTHDGRPGEHGKCAVICDSLSREAVWDALWNRRCYATTGPRVWLDFRMDSQAMGSTLQRRAGEEVLLFAEAVAEAPIASFAVLRDGKALVERSGSEHVSLERTIRAAPGSFYLLRVTQTDGHIAWSSPIWIDPPSPAR